MKKQYIKQEDDCACGLIAVMNHVIERDGECSVKYKSPEFLELFKKCGGGENNGITCPRPAFSLFEIDFEEAAFLYPDFYVPSKDYERLIIRKLREGKNVMFDLLTLHDPSWHHTVLIVEYKKSDKTFKIINAPQCEDTDNTYEYLTWEQLSRGFYKKDSEYMSDALRRSLLLTRFLF